MLLEVPTDVFEAQYQGALDYLPVPMSRTAPDPIAVKAAARMLLDAKNPVLWAGQGVLYAEAGERLAALAELIPAPVLTTTPGKSAANFARLRAPYYRDLDASSAHAR